MSDARPAHPSIRALGKRLAALERMVRDQAMADQADARAVTDGSIDVYDDDGELRGRAGKQPDGGYTFKTFGKKPETPTEPDVLPVPGGCVVEWDGTFEDAQTDEIQRIAIHVGLTPDFEINDDDDEESDDEATERAAILSPRGGSAFLALDPGEGRYWIRLTAVAEGGVESDPSPAVEVVISPSEVVFEQDHFVLPQDGAQDLTLRYTPVDNSDHVYWCGLYQPEDITWTRIGQVVSLTGTPFPPKEGDLVVVEYAYIAGEQPEVIPLDGASATFNANGSNGSTVLNMGPGFDDASWTFEFLWQPRQPPAKNELRTIFENSAGVNVVTSFRLRMNDARKLQLSLRDGPWTNYTETVGLSVFEMGYSHHVAIQCERTGGGAMIRVLVDGRLEIEKFSAEYYVENNFSIGGPYSGLMHLEQYIDEVVAYKRVVPEAELAAHRARWDRGGYPAAILASNPWRYYRFPGRLDVVTGTETAATIIGGQPHVPGPALQKGDEPA